MRIRLAHALAPFALGVLLAGAASPLVAGEAGVKDFAAAKAEAEKAGKLVLIDFSSPT